MSLLMAAEVGYSADPAVYIPQAEAAALADLRTGLSRRGGHLQETRSWQDDDGHWLAVAVTLDSQPGLIVRFARVLLRTSGPDMGPELSGLIYGTGLTERLDTKLATTPAIDGVVTF